MGLKVTGSVTLHGGSQLWKFTLPIPRTSAIIALRDTSGVGAKLARNLLDPTCTTTADRFQHTYVRLDYHNLLGMHL